MSAFDYFEDIYCISVNENRRKRAAAEFEKAGILHRINWVTGPVLSDDMRLPNYHRNPPKELGCSLSHLQIIIKNIGSKNVLIFEDDVVFKHTNITSAISELPNNWNALFLGMLPRSRLTRYSNHLAVIHGVWWGVFAYALNGHILRNFSVYWTKNAFKHREEGSAIDNLLYTFLDKPYVCYPPVCTCSGPSTIGNTVTDQQFYWRIS